MDLNPVVIDAMSRLLCNSAKCNNLLSSVMEIELCKHFIKYGSPFCLEQLKMFVRCSQRNPLEPPYN
jgi:hypothetical protein